MSMQDQHLYKSPAVEVYGHYKFLLPWLRVPSWLFFAMRGWKIAGMGCLGLNPQPQIFVLSQVPMTSQTSKSSNWEQRFKVRTAQVLSMMIGS